MLREREGEREITDRIYIDEYIKYGKRKGETENDGKRKKERECDG